MNVFIPEIDQLLDLVSRIGTRKRIFHPSYLKILVENASRLLDYGGRDRHPSFESVRMGDLSGLRGRVEGCRKPLTFDFA